MISKEQLKNIICSMDDVLGDFLGPPHGTPSAAVIANKNETGNATVCMLVFYPIIVDNYAAFLNCTPVGRASDSMMAPT